MRKPQSEVQTTAKNKIPVASKYSVPALEKGLEILELISLEENGLTQTELASRMKRSINEIFRMIICLRDLGYVSFLADSDRYVMTPKVFEIAHRHPPMKRLISQALPLMKDLAYQLDQSCHLSVYNDGRQVVVAQVDNPDGMGFSVRMGAQIDLLRSASGRVLLAFQSPEVTDRMMTEYHGTASGAEIEQVRRQLKQIREAGFAEMDSVQVRGVRGIAFPVRDPQDHAVAALVVPFLEQIDDPRRKKLNDAQKGLARASAAITRAIGGDQGALPEPSASKKTPSSR